jgi:hypothetical protein
MAESNRYSLSAIIWLYYTSYNDSVVLFPPVSIASLDGVDFTSLVPDVPSLVVVVVPFFAKIRRESKGLPNPLGCTLRTLVVRE